MVSKLNVFASEVTRVSLEVGTRGNLGVQAVVHGVEGTWLGLTNNVRIVVNESARTGRLTHWLAGQPNGQESH